MCMYQILSLSMNIQYKKNAKVSELVRLFICWDKSVMQLYFLTPSKEKKKVSLCFLFSRQNPVYSFNQLLSWSGGKEEGRDQSRKTAFQSTKKNGGIHAHVKFLFLSNRQTYPSNRVSDCISGNDSQITGSLHNYSPAVETNKTSVAEIYAFFSSSLKQYSLSTKPMGFLHLVEYIERQMTCCLILKRLKFILVLISFCLCMKQTLHNTSLLSLFYLKS